MPSDVGVSASPALRLQQLMSRYQQADATAVPILMRSHTACGRTTTGSGKELSPRLYRFFASQMGSRTDADDMLQDLWLRIASRETAVAVLPDLSKHRSASSPVPFEDLVVPLSERQRIVLTMLKVNGMSIEEVARATASTIGAVKQDAHRAYERLRRLFERVPSGQPLRSGWRRIEIRTQPKIHNCPRVRREFISEKG